MRMSESNMVILLVTTIQLYERAWFVEGNIGQGSLAQKVKCCGAAKPQTHRLSRKALILDHAGGSGPPEDGKTKTILAKFAFVTIATNFHLCAIRMELIMNISSCYCFGTATFRGCGQAGSRTAQWSSRRRRSCSIAGSRRN